MQRRPISIPGFSTYPVSNDGYTNCQTARQFVTEVLSQCLDVRRRSRFCGIG